MGKRAGLVSGSNDWTRYSNTSSSIEKRTGLTKSEIQQLRREAREISEGVEYDADVWGIERSLEGYENKPGMNPKGIDLTKDRSGSNPVERIGRKNIIGIEFEGLTPRGVNFDLPGGFEFKATDEGVGIGGLGFGVEFGEGRGSIDLPGGISIDFIEKGCYIVEVNKLFGQYVNSNIQKKPGCDDDSEDEEEGNENKPPHCIGSNKKAGGGSPQNRYPECANDGEEYQFYWYGSEIREVSRTYDSGRGGDKDWVAFYRHNLVTDPQCESRPKIQGGNPVQPGNYIDVEYREETLKDGTIKVLQDETKTGFMTGDFRGTYSELIENYFTNANQPTDETTTNRNNFRGYTEKTRTRRWITVIACNADGTNVSCNPGDNEGCGSSNNSGSGNNERGGNRPFPKPRGGNKRPGKGNNGDDDMSRCCNDVTELMKLVLDAVGYNLSPIEVPDSLVNDENSEPVVLPNLASFVI